MIDFSHFKDGVRLIFEHHLTAIFSLFITLCYISGNSVAEIYKEKEEALKSNHLEVNSLGIHVLGANTLDVSGLGLNDSKTDDLAVHGLKKEKFDVQVNNQLRSNDSQDVFFVIEQQDESLIKIKDQQDEIDFGLNLEQQKFAQEHDDEVKNYNILQNQFYKNERIRIFNHTAFNSNDFKNKLGSGEFNVDGLQALTISFGYGMEFKINNRNRIGYEYLSSFPYNRGQLIRIFWLRKLKY